MLSHDRSKALLAFRHCVDPSQEQPEERLKKAVADPGRGDSGVRGFGQSAQFFFRYGFYDVVHMHHWPCPGYESY